MTDINSVNIVGRLTRDGDLRYTNSGTPVNKFSIAVNRSKKNGDQWEEEVNFFDVVLWGKPGEVLSQYLKKGQQVAVSGELRQSRWEQDGQTRSKVEIQAHTVQLMGGKKDNQQGQQNQGYQNQGNNAFGGSQNTYGSDQFDDDGIPF